MSETRLVTVRIGNPSSSKHIARLGKLVLSLAIFRTWVLSVTSIIFLDVKASVTNLED